MREILFRGKRLDNGEWVTGYLEYFYSKAGTRKLHCFISVWGETLHTVDPATVGQYTGLMANGKRIFEGDIVRRGNRNGYVSFGNGCFNVKDSASENHPAIDVVMLEHDVVVIGNIHDNPELLEVTHDE
jgi:uncharacterized phage protein (TIGR01671 family)